MVIIVLIVATLCVGIPIIIGWASIDALFGVHTLTEPKAVAVMGIVFVVLVIATVVGFVIEEFCNDWRPRVVRPLLEHRPRRSGSPRTVIEEIQKELS